MEPVTFTPFGVIRTPFTDIEGMPIQPTAAVGVRGRIELDPALAEGLADVDGFSHLLLIYHLDGVRAPRLTVTPFLDDATVEIVEVDVLDGTPLLDMKPYVPALDDRADARVGWFATRLDRLAEARSDERFR